jgi:hypothetical protein
MSRRDCPAATAALLRIGQGNIDLAAARSLLGAAFTILIARTSRP